MKIKRVSDQFVRNFKLRICHISDTHGTFNRLHGSFDVVLHTGDFLPDSQKLTEGNKVGQAKFQIQWLRDNIPEMRKWLQGHTFLFILGNHDFVSPEIMEAELISEGINAINLTDKVITYQGVNFFGFPYVPAINGMFNYEREIPEMQEEVKKIVEALNTSYVEVLACHAPIYNSLDLSNANKVLGSTVIADALDYQVKKEMQPAYYLHGHIHNAHGIKMRNGMLISNAATVQHIIEVT